MLIIIEHILLCLCLSYSLSLSLYIYIYISCVWKVTGMVLQTIYFNSKLQTILFPFQSNPHPESKVLYYPSLLRFYALLEGFYWDAP